MDAAGKNERFYRTGTLGVGGAGRSAALYAWALDMPYQDWTSSGGIKTANTDYVANAKLLRVASREEVREGAMAGNRVIQASTMIDLNGSNVEMTIHSIYDPNAEPGTRILPRRTPSEDELPVIAVAGKVGLDSFAIVDQGMNETHNYIRDRVMDPMGRLEGDFNIDYINTTQDSATLTFPYTESEQLELLKAKVEARLLSKSNSRIVVRTDRGVVCLVGAKLKDTRVRNRVANEARTRLFDADVLMHFQNESEQSASLSFVVDASFVPVAIAALHNQFLEQA
jgi:aspartokinase